MIQMNVKYWWENKQSIFKNVIRDIAKKYNKINKGLLLSFKKDFVDVSPTQQVIKIMDKENRSRVTLHKKKESYRYEEKMNKRK